MATQYKNSATSVGFYGVTPATRPTAYTQTYSTASKTVPATNLATVTPTATSGTPTGTQTTPWGFGSEADFNALITRVNALITDVANLKTQIDNAKTDHENNKKVLTQIIDDLQTIGLLQ